MPTINSADRGNLRQKGAMKVFTYNIAAAKRNRPKMSAPLARTFYNEGQGKNLAFLLSEKGRLYVVKGDGVVNFPADQLEQAAFEKYAPLRDMKLYMVTRIRSVKRKKAGSELRLICDYYDYHQKVFLRGQSLRVARVYKNVNVLWAVLNGGLTEVDESKLQVNRKNQELADEAELDKMAGAVSSSALMSAMCILLAMFFMALFYFFGLFFALRGIKKFGRIVKSDYKTRRRDAYTCVGCILLVLANIAGIILVPLLH